MPKGLSVATQKYRLVTRSDFDGLICAVLLKELDLISTIKFVHPKEMQDGKVEITAQDIVANLPYVPTAYLVFDHHVSEVIRLNLTETPSNLIIDPNAPSASRLVYEYYGGKKAFPNVDENMLIAVDKADSGQFTREEVLFPKDWILLNYLMDPRSGLERYKQFRISNYDFMMVLIDYCRTHNIEQILALSDTKERIALYFNHQRESMYQIEKCVQMYGDLIVIDLRNEKEIYVANRFIVYALYPECNISIHVLWGAKKQTVMFAVGCSIINRTSQINVGEHLLKYGGGGHAKAGTCQVSPKEAEQVLQQLIAEINADG
jgi:nanoRNase/pAp phosphatase (c-di-AMP/oligoRNAs hydrolase)